MKIAYFGLKWRPWWEIIRFNQMDWRPGLLPWKSAIKSNWMHIYIYIYIYIIDLYLYLYLYLYIYIYLYLYLYLYLFNIMTDLQHTNNVIACQTFRCCNWSTIGSCAGTWSITRPPWSFAAWWTAWVECTTLPRRAALERGTGRVGQLTAQHGGKGNLGAENWSSTGWSYLLKSCGRFLGITHFLEPKSWTVTSAKLKATPSGAQLEHFNFDIW